MPDIRFNKNQNYDTSELEVLMSLKRNIFRNLKVGSLGEVKEINDNNEALVTLFPAYKNEVEISIWTQISKSANVQVEDVVVILFLDRNFKQSLRQTLRREKRTGLELTNVQLHDYHNAIIIANVNRSSGGGSDMYPITDVEIDLCFA